MSEEFWKTSPFGQDSIFHPSWEEKQNKLRFQGYEGAKIVDIIIMPNYSPENNGLLLPPKPAFIKNTNIVSSDSNSVIVAVKVTVHLSKKADKVKIALNKNSEITASKSISSNFQYEAKFNVKVNKALGPVNPSNSQEFTFTASVTDVFTKEVTDKRIQRFSVDTNGIINNSNIVEPLTTIEFHIYANGKMEEWIPKEYSVGENNIIRYIYHDANSKKHEIGLFNVKTIKNIYGSTYGEKTVDMIDIRELKNYLSETVYFRMSINTNRYFMNKKTLGSLIGAMLECSYNDFVFNGFSNEKGESTGGSTTHKNGQNGDLRYLRLDQSGKRMDLRISDETGDPCGWKGLDETRQNAFNEALFKFGWKSMLSYQYNNDSKLLDRCSKDKSLRHYDHLHVQGYNPQFITIIKLFKNVTP